MSPMCRPAVLTLLAAVVPACDLTDPGPAFSVEIIAPAPLGNFGGEPFVAIQAGESVPFVAQVTDAAGNVADRSIEWEVRSDAFFRIDETGLVQAGSYVEACGTSRPPCGSTAVIARSEGAMDTLVAIPLPPTLLLEVAPRDTTVLAVGESAEFTLMASMPPEPEVWSHCATPSLRPQASDVVSWETLSTVTEHPDGVWVSRSVYRATAVAPGVTGLSARVQSTFCSDQVEVGGGPPPAIRVVD